jgi:hypothetical protein
MEQSGEATCAGRAGQNGAMVEKRKDPELGWQATLGSRDLGQWGSAGWKGGKLGVTFEAF